MFGQKKVNKEAIIAEYLTGGISYRHLGEKYGIDFRIINYWVLKYQRKEGKESPSKKATTQSILSKTEPPPAAVSAVDVEQLQKELRAAKLQNTLLNVIIDTAEEQLKISIRKKSGTRQ